MRITGVTTYIVPPAISETAWVNGDPWVLVEVRTDDGLNGWGQAYTRYDREGATANNVLALAEGLIGTDPLCIRIFVQSAHQRRVGAVEPLEWAAATAGIELALWDIAGKARGVPVHALLGRACKERIKVYANCWSNVARDPDEMAAFAAAQVGRGFHAVKLYPFLHGVSAAHGVACIAAVRAAVGREVTIFIDFLEQEPPGGIEALAPALRAQAVAWLEDPAPADAPQDLARIRQQTGLPVITGEELYESTDFLRLCTMGAADRLNPEVTLLGLLGMGEVAAIARAHGLPIAIHNANTMTIGLGAALQAAALTPNSDWLEYFPTLEAGSDSFSSFARELDAQGTFRVSRAPGLGARVDCTALTGMVAGRA